MPTPQEMLDLARQNQDASGDIGTFARAYLELYERCKSLEHQDVKAPPIAPSGAKNASHKRGAHR